MNELPNFQTHNDAPSLNPLVNDDFHVEKTMADPTTAAMALRGLKKSFGDKEVVHGISLDIPRGSLYGIVGPNGAGKTTTLSMATGLLRPSAGDAFIMGHDMWRDSSAAKRQMGVVADGLRTFDRLTGRELLTFVGLLHEVDPHTLDARSEELLNTLDLSADADKLVVDYSAGMTKKILLASALIHAPKLLILDEPLEAVDPVSAQVIRKILQRFVRGGGTVVFSSHVMEVVEGLCSHVAVINKGELIASGELDTVRQGRSLSDQFLDLVGGVRDVEGGLAWLNS